MSYMSIVRNSPTKVKLYYCEYLLLLHIFTFHVFMLKTHTFFIIQLILFQFIFRVTHFSSTHLVLDKCHSTILHIKYFMR